MADELKDQRVVTMMAPSELQSIDDWSFANRIRSRGEAIRRLCQVGLAIDDQAEDLRQMMMTLIDAYAMEKGIQGGEDDLAEDYRQGVDLEERARLKSLSGDDLTTEIIMLMAELEGRLRDMAQTAHMLRHKDFSPESGVDRREFVKVSRAGDSALLNYMRHEIAKKKSGTNEGNNE